VCRQFHAVGEGRGVGVDGHAGDAAPVRRVLALGRQVIERGVRALWVPTGVTVFRHVIDALYLEVVDLVVGEILLQAPVASDLRFLLSVLRIVPELERSHDLIVQIASGAGHVLSGELSPRSRGSVERMGNLASGMWGQAAQAWYERDRSVAPVLAGRNEEMGRLHAGLRAELASGQMALPVTMEMTLVAHCYGRLGAHAVNIARRVAYLAGRAAG
jgi:phosphate transport system protein